MLILNRRPGEVLVITVPGRDPIKVTILGVKDNQVRIGTEAELDIGIDREEIHKRKMAEKTNAA